MTGFGRASSVAAGKRITVELKSLNSKQLDLNVRMPSIFRELEIELRHTVLAELERGKVELTVSVETLGGGEASTRLNTAVLADYRRQIAAASAEMGIPEPADWWAVLMRMPDSVLTDGNDSLDPALADALRGALAAAVEAINGHRRAEGLRLESFFAERIAAIEGLLAEVEPYEAERVPRIRARIEDGLSKIAVADYDKGRLEQEMIFYIEKLDINEEKQRLRQHLRYFTETLEGPRGQGKKLGFIAQEMGREINTLGSKSNQADMQAIVVKMKDLLEQIKEQVLNVL